MEVTGRLSDTLNRREPIDIDDVRWAPFDGSEPLVDGARAQERSIRTT